MTQSRTTCSSCGGQGGDRAGMDVRHAQKGAHGMLSAKFMSRAHKLKNIQIHF